jgi:predicted dehydrogenase
VKLNVAVIGAGRNGSQFIQAYSNHPAVSEVFFADPYPPLRERYGGLPKVKKTYANSEDMLSNEEVDLVSIHTPGHLHTAYFVKAAEHRRHIFVEKPLATSIEDIRTIVRAAKGNPGRKMAVGHNYRYEDYNSQIKSLIDDGALGRIVCIRLGYITDYFYFWQTEPKTEFIVKPPVMAQMRPILEGGCHHIDLANWFTGSRPQRVHAVACPLDVNGVPADWLAAVFHYENQSIFHMDASFGVIAPHKYNFGIEIYGTEGSIRDDMLYRFASKQYHLREFTQTPLKKKEQAGHSFVEEVDSMLAAIVEDKPVLVTVAEGAMAAAGAVAAEMAIRTPGNTIDVPSYV